MPVRIAGVQGFYGDSPMGALAIASSKAVDYLVHDALSELTLSILHKDKQKDPNLGYARDIEFLAAKVWPTALKNGMRVVTNAGGLNPKAAADRIAEIFRKRGLKDTRIAIVTGDDLLDRLEDLVANGADIRHMETEEAFSDAGFSPTHASVYTGAEPIRAALEEGADVVITGRVADPCLTLGIAAYAHDWKLEGDLSQDELDRIAGAIVAGHVIECGGQASGGNSYAEWPMDYSLSNLAYPIAHVFADGHAEFTRLTTEGGKVSRDTIREQLVYELHDPGKYITPDVEVDLKGIELTEKGPDLVELKGVKGNPRPDKLKLAMGKQEGYLSDQFFYFSWPFAYEKAKKFIHAVKEIMGALPAQPERLEFTFPGINGIHPGVVEFPDTEAMDEINEICVRVALFHTDANLGKIALQAVIGLALNGPPGLVSVPGWGLRSRTQLSLWPALIDRSLIQSEIEYIDL